MCAQDGHLSEKLAGWCFAFFFLNYDKLEKCGNEQRDSEAGEAGEECCWNVWIFWSGGREIIKASSTRESGGGKEGAGWEPHGDVAPALLPSKSTWTWTLPVWTEISRENHMKKPGKKKKEKKKTKPSAVEPNTICMHENLRSVAVSFISVMAVHHPRKILSRRPCYFWRGGMLDAAPRVRRLDAFSGSGPCQGSPRVWPVFRLLHGEVFCGD